MERVNYNLETFSQNERHFFEEVELRRNDKSSKNAFTVTKA